MLLEMYYIIAMKKIQSFFILILVVSAIFQSSCTTKNSVENTFTNRDTLGFNYIDIVHVTHTDYGYTDHPIIAIDLHKRYIDIALDLALTTCNEAPENRFVWTVEALDPFCLWWQEAPKDRRKAMLKIIKNKQIGINAMPFHIHPFVNARQWEEMVNWVPEDLRSELDIEVGMQHDVNGFPRSAAKNLLDKGVDYLWTGINAAWGGSPFKLPTAFWWKMPDNRKLLVWAGYPYWEGYVFFSAHAWRAAQREAANTEFSWPRDGDVLKADEQSVRKAHEVCISRLKDLRKQGYSYPFLALSFTNQWRMDNDGPIAQLQPFVKKWNELGLKPALRMTTAAEALKRIEKEVGDKIATLEGEWQDWWSFGAAASPVELQAARRAVQYVKAVESPFWGVPSEAVNAEVKAIDRMLCRYYEHTFASNETSSKPFSLFNLGQLNEKATFAYRPYERGRWLLAQLTRSKFTVMESGLYVANTGAAPYTGWVKLDAVGFRGQNFQSVKDVKTSKEIPIYRNGDEAFFWVSAMQPESYTHYLLQTDAIKTPTTIAPEPELTFDRSGWISTAKWPGMAEPLFDGSLGDFMVLTINDMNRWAMVDYIHLDSIRRQELVDKYTEVSWAKCAQKVDMNETPYSYVLEQEMQHPRVKFMKRKVEIFKEIPRVKFKLTYNRISSSIPEIFYVKFPFPKNSGEILTTNGGVPFTPYTDHLPNSCKDFFVVDSWVKYAGKDGARIWSSPDVPIVNFGGHNFLTRINNRPANSNELYGMLYNNTWVVNFSVDTPGEMTFEFDLAFEKGNPGLEAINKMVDAYMVPMPVMNNPNARENAIVGKHMNTPKRVTISQ